MNKKVIIWGAGGHALVVADVIRAGGQYEVAGFLVDQTHLAATRPTLAGHVLGGAEEMDAVLAAGIELALVAVGDCKRRLELGALFERHGFSLVVAVHPAAILAPDVQIGPGTLVAAGAVLNPGVTVAQSVIVNTGAIIDHECKLGAGVHVSSGAQLGGAVVVGEATWIGLGASIQGRISIGANTIIGAGSVVVSDIPSGVFAYGAPAKVTRQITVAP